MQKKLLALVLSSLFAAPALAGEAPASAPTAPYTVTANVGMTTDYVFNGISQNFRSPAIQGGVDFVHTNGIFLGSWASNISGNQYTNASLEWDIYGGYTGKVNDDLSYTAGLLSVIYPGGITNPAAAGPTRKWDTSEFNIGGTWKGMNIKYSQTLTNWYGISGALGGGFEPNLVNAAGVPGATTANKAAADLDSRGSGYLEANYSYELADKLVISAHAGHQKVKNYDLLSYTDFKLGVTKEIGGYVLGAAYTTTNATDNTLYNPTDATLANSSRKNLHNGYLGLSVNRTF